MNQQIKFQFKKVAVNGLFLTALIFILAAPSLFTLKMISREYTVLPCLVGHRSKCSAVLRSTHNHSYTLSGKGKYDLFEHCYQGYVLLKHGSVHSLKDFLSIAYKKGNRETMFWASISGVSSIPSHSNVANKKCSEWVKISCQVFEGF